MKTAKERQLEELASELEIPILLRQDIEKHKDSLILKWSDGNWFIYTISIKPTLNEDNQSLSLDSSINFSFHKAGVKDNNIMGQVNTI